VDLLLRRVSLPFHGSGFLSTGPRLSPPADQLSAVTSRRQGWTTSVSRIDLNPSPRPNLGVARKSVPRQLGALAHFDFNQAGACAYEQALLTLRQLKLPMAAAEEQFRRMVFNIVARNQGDQVKNIAFLMNQRSEWSLAPAFDVTYSYNPSGSWTARHQMTLNGKRDAFRRDDFEVCAKAAAMKRGRAATIIAEVQAAVRRWPEFAVEARLSDEWCGKIKASHRLTFP
ncbi:MAG: HipA domain-containing protein, partial [Verrucomicrobia bacterium]|nr:HipA domain-containing protein [Verrucomicrobiota bacterium]